MAGYKGLSYECKSCECILEDVEQEENNGICNTCLLEVYSRELCEEEEEDGYWQEFK